MCLFCFSFRSMFLFFTVVYSVSVLCCFTFLNALWKVCESVLFFFGFRFPSTSTYTISHPFSSLLYFFFLCVLAIVSLRIVFVVLYAKSNSQQLTIFFRSLQSFAYHSHSLHTFYRAPRFTISYNSRLYTKHSHPYMHTHTPPSRRQRCIYPLHNSLSRRSITNRNFPSIH